MQKQFISNGAGKKGLLLVLATAIISGFSVFINKYGVAMGNPSIFTFTKNTAVALLLTALVLSFRNRQALRQIKARQWGQLVLIGLLGGSIPFLLFYQGLAMTSAAQGAFIHKTIFIFVAGLAVIFLKEKINKNFLLGALLLVLGNLVALKSLNFSFGLGDALILLAVLFWAAETILAKQVLRKMSGSLVAWGRMCFGAIFIFIYLLAAGQASQLLMINATQIGWVIITSVFLLGYVLTWYNGLKYVPVSVATTILLLGSPITACLTALSAGRLVKQDVYSGVLIAGGLILIVSFDWLWGRVKKYVWT